MELNLQFEQHFIYFLIECINFPLVENYMFCGERKENLSKFCPRSAITLSAFVHVAAYTNSPQQHETYQNTNYKILLLYKNKKKINLKENTLVKRRTRQCINRRAAVNSSSSAAIQYNLLICFSYAATSK